MEWYKKSPEDLAIELQTDLKKGLNASQVDELLKEHGENKLEEAKRKPLSQKLLDQLKDPMVIILILASILSALTGDAVEAIIIIAVVVLNAILSIYQEGKAEDSVAALQKMSSPEAHVIRDGNLQKVKSSLLVPGDLVVLETGDIVPADLRLMESSNLQIDESSFTGESVAADKDASVFFDQNVGIGDRENYAFSSTIVTYGHGKGIVTDTGIKTEIGKIATSIQSYDEEETPLQKKLAVLSKQLSIIVLIVAVVVFGLGILARNEILSIALTAISLAVAAIPEGLTAVVTIVLSMGMNRMAKKNAIVKKLLSVETLGTTTYICSDKTGTLTQNEMTVTKAYVDGQVLEVTGPGYGPEGQVKNGEETVTAESSPSLQSLAGICTLTNDASIVMENGDYQCIGDPTEGALITFANKLGVSKEDYNKEYPRIEELPFDSTRKMMTTFHENFFDHKLVSFTKGAPDIIINRCDFIFLNGKVEEFTPKRKEEALKKNSEFAKDALRCLAYAFRVWDKLPSKDEKTPDHVENQMIFVGLTGMIDPPRPEVKEAIKECKSAGITPVMITGDYLETAFAIGKDLGIASDPEEAMMGEGLNGLSVSEVQEIVKTKRIFARVSPENKVQIVEALKANGEITAMTGDGVNDAPAIKKADIGIAMGITGTDVTKNTSDVILTDDNFATIVHSVEEGRIIYSNIKKFVSFLLSCNIGEVIVIAVAMIIDLALVLSNSGHRFPTPLSPIMLLWLNLVTDSLPALALGVEPGEKDIMKEKPRDPKESIIDKEMQGSIVVQSIAIGVCTLLAFSIGYFYFGKGLDAQNQLMEGQTMAFATLILAELFRAFASRSDKYTLFEIGVFSNKSMVRAVVIGILLLLIVLYIPILRSLFEVSFMTAKEWIPTLILSILPFAAAEIHQAIETREK